MEEELSREEKLQVEGHLNACEKCGLALKDLRWTIELAKNIGEEEPPSWLRQKVMARVREEAAQKKGIFQTLFFPHNIKVPIGIFATIAITLTAFYVFKTVEPDLKQPASITSPPVDIQATEKKEVLEQSGVPAPEEWPAEAPEPSRRKIEAEDLALTTDKAEEAVSLTEEKAVRQEASGAAGFRMKRELRTLAPGAMMKAGEAEKQVMSMTVFVKDTLNVNEEIEKTLKKLGGEIIRSEVVGEKLFFTVKLNAGKVKELKEALKLLGEVQGEAALSYAEGEVEIGIKLVKTEVRLH
jgi:hypothetical protein